jgi:DNA anti-recombination protein RmuC
METFAEVFERLGTHLKNAQQSYGEADKRLEKTQNTLDGLVSNSVPDAAIESSPIEKPVEIALPAAAEASPKTGSRAVSIELNAEKELQVPLFFRNPNSRG